MKKLKKLSQNDLDNISNYLYSIASGYILSKVSPKEIIDMDIKIEVSYDEKLNVDMSINLEFDELSKADSNIAQNAIDTSLLKINSYLDDNFRV